MTAGLLLEVPGDWRHRARCKIEQAELFFPTGTTGPAKAQMQSAKKICARCPVRSECLQWALNAGPDADYGVWGGLDEKERRRLRRGRRRVRRKIPPHGTETRYANPEIRCRCQPCRDAHAARSRDRYHKRQAS